MVLKTIDLPNLGQKQQGKVRDFYIVDDKRVTVTTDRQSAFDVVLGHIPYKGAVLNMLAAFWFEKTRKIVPNHLIAIPDPNVLISKNAQVIPIEMIVRGYISGVTKTSIWYSYEKGERLIYGLNFPDGLKKNQKLPKPVITPTTHGGGAGGHDERLTREEIIKRKLVPQKLYEQMEQASLALFEFGSKLCQKNGLILVDTKYEFGLDEKGDLMLIDEIHTPDSSRFWKEDTYKERFKRGEEPENFDKEFLRLWYADRGYKGDGKPPKMSEQLITDLSKRYIAVYEKITGQKFKIFDYPVEKRIKQNVVDYLNGTNSGAKKLHYEQSGDNYQKKDFVKIIALKIAKKTYKNLDRFKKYGIEIVEDPNSRGESAYRVIIKSKKPINFQLAHVEESIGTKNIIADELEKIYGKTYYFQSAIDNAGCILNDLSTSGAFPISYMLHVATFPNEWYTDNLDRWRALIEGTAKACDLSGASFGGGESATDRDIIIPGRALLSGSATGIIIQSDKVLSEDKLQVGDRIVLLESSGVHANGITLLRNELLARLPLGYKTKLPDGTTYGEAVITPQKIYSKLVEDIVNETEIHYAVHITGHGWRKIMRANKPFTYVINTIPKPQPIFDLIKKYSNSSDTDMYDSYNMGAGFALYVPQKSVPKILALSKKHKIKAWDAGVVQKGPRKLIIEPLGLEFNAKDLEIR